MYTIVREVFILNYGNHYKVQHIYSLTFTAVFAIPTILALTLQRTNTLTIHTLRITVVCSTLLEESTGCGIHTSLLISV